MAAGGTGSWVFIDDATADGSTGRNFGVQGYTFSLHSATC